MIRRWWSADEPTGNLDLRTAQAVVSLFERLAENGKTVLMVTHDIDLALHAGRLVASCRRLDCDDQTKDCSSEGSDGRMIAPTPWRKVLRDIWVNRARTVLSS